ncbi:MAG TPA: PilZ domain-containing protein [Candidatus Acidoferrales bacterium]|nr:PilZ domain-containing protein [Candidatus Acidoferrales bacterium]
MSASERRGAPRKGCAVPLRFRVVSEENNGQAESLEPGFAARPMESGANGAACEGEAFNLSERGVYFRARERVNVGERLEMYFTLPRELTGRAPEQIRCSARVVHVEESPDHRGTTGIGAFVERFEPLKQRRNWSN